MQSRKTAGVASFYFVITIALLFLAPASYGATSLSFFLFPFLFNIFISARVSNRGHRRWNGGRPDLPSKLNVGRMLLRKRHRSFLAGTSLPSFPLSFHYNFINL